MCKCLKTEGAHLESEGVNMTPDPNVYMGNDNFLYVEDDCNETEYCIKVNYCPICGRKINNN